MFAGMALICCDENGGVMIEIATWVALAWAFVYVFIEAMSED